MKKTIAILLSLCLCLGMAACGGSPAKTDPPAAQTTAGTTPGDIADDLAEATEQVTPEQPANGEKPKVGFVTFGLQGGAFFVELANAYEAKMEEAGWEALVIDGNYDPTTQINACENYIAEGVDAIVIWAVAPEAMTTVLTQAMDAGIKVISFVGLTEVYDVLLISEEVALAGFACKVAAQWIDSTFADAEDHSVPVAILSMRGGDTTVKQADALKLIGNYSKKAKFEVEVECSDEGVESGVSAAENLYMTNPEIKVILSAHSGLALGANNYYTGINSPITDFSEFGIFCINGSGEIADAIKLSTTNEAPLRGAVLTGGVDDTALDIQIAVTGAYAETIEPGTIMKAATVFVVPETIDEYLETGRVTSLTEADFPDPQ